MTASKAILALVISIVALGMVTALAYRSVANGVFAIVGAVILLVLAGGVAWASGHRRSG